MSEPGDDAGRAATGGEDQPDHESGASVSPLTEQQKAEGWMDILENGQLLKRTVEAGDTSSSRPERGCRVVIRLTTRNKQTGDVVQSETYDRLEAFVGDYDVVHGVDLMLPLMHKGEVANVVIHDRFAYGSAGKEPDIPANCTLDCEIQLLEVQWLDSESQLPLNDRIKYGRLKKERGNFWFGRDDFSSAIHCYRRAAELLDATDDEMNLLHSPSVLSKDQPATHTLQSDTQEHEEYLSQMKQTIRELIDLRATAFNNLAAAQMKSQAFDQALKSVNSSLDLKPDNVKALYRKGKILAARNEFAEAIECLKSASKLEPESRTIMQEMSLLASKRKQEIANERKLYQKMLRVDPNSANSVTGNTNRSKWLPNVLSSATFRTHGLLLLACSAVILGIFVFYVTSI